MKRRYTAAEYEATVERIRAARARTRPSRRTSSSGFRARSDEDFEETLALVRRVRFGSLSASGIRRAPARRRRGWGSETEVPDEVSAARLKRLLDLQTGIQHEINQGLVGREFEILVEGEDRKGQSKGRTSCNRIIHVEDGGSAAARAVRPGAGRARSPEFAGGKTLGVSNPGEAR